MTVASLALYAKKQAKQPSVKVNQEWRSPGAPKGDGFASLWEFFPDLIKA